MNLLARTAEFERLCYQLTKRAQSSSWRIDPETGQMVNKIPPASLSGPTPHFSVPAKQEPNASTDPGMSKDPRMTPDPRATNPQAKHAPLQPGAHPGAPAHSSAPKTSPSTKAPIKPLQPKPSRQPAPWLVQYQKEQNTESKPISSVQKAVERSNKTPSFDADRAAKEQVEQAKKPFGK